MSVPFQSSSALHIAGGRQISHGFFGRQGGVSTGAYSSLNCAPCSLDSTENIVANRNLCTQALGVHLLYTARQTHSATALFLDAPPADTAQPVDADALVTNIPGLAIGALAADCMTVLMYDPTTQLIAATHAGWRGTLRGILPACLKVLRAHGANLQELRAAFGPSLRQANFEVGADLRDAFIAKDPTFTQFFAPLPRRTLSKSAGLFEEKWVFDLIGLGKNQLITQGLLTRHIDILPGCTLATPDRYFSYRAARRSGHKDFGRHLSAIALIA